MDIPCATCGGKRGHVNWCPELQREREEQSRRSREFAAQYNASQKERFASLTGKVIAKVERGYGFIITFSDGWRLKGTVTGGGVAGHGESYSTETVLSVDSPEEVQGAWDAFYRKNKHILGNRR